MYLTRLKISGCSEAVRWQDIYVKQMISSIVSDISMRVVELPNQLPSEVSNNALQTPLQRCTLAVLLTQFLP